LGLLSPPIPSFSGICKVRKYKKIPVGNSAFHAQGSRVFRLVVQVGAVKIYVAVVESLKEKERRDKTQFSTKIAGKTT
jgi:predicted proteasome-type protease